MEFYDVPAQTIGHTTREASGAPRNAADEYYVRGGAKKVQDSPSIHHYNRPSGATPLKGRGGGAESNQLLTLDVAADLMDVLGHPMRQSQHVNPVRQSHVHAHAPTARLPSEFVENATSALTAVISDLAGSGILDPNRSGTSLAFQQAMKDMDAVPRKGMRLTERPDALAFSSPLARFSPTPDHALHFPFMSPNPNIRAVSPRQTQVLAVSPRHSQADLALIPEMGQALRSSRPSEAEIEARLEAALAKRRATLAAEREKAPLPVAVESERAYTYTPPNPAKKEATLTDFQMIKDGDVQMVRQHRLVGYEVPVEKPVEKIVEKVVYVDREVHVDRPVEKIVYVEKPVYLEKFRDVEVPGPERIVFRDREVPVEKIVYRDRDVPVYHEITKEVPVKVPVEVERERIVYRDREVPVEVEKIVTKEVPVEKIVTQYQEIPVEVEKIVEKIVEVERIVEVPVQVPYEVVREVEKIVEVEVEVEKVVTKYVNMEVEKVVTKEVPVERVVIKEVPVEVIKEKVVYRDREVPVEVYREVPVEKIVYRDRVQGPDTAERATVMLANRVTATRTAPAQATRAPQIGLEEYQYQVPKQTFETQKVKVPKIRYEAVHYEEEVAVQVPRVIYENQPTSSTAAYTQQTVGLGIAVEETDGGFFVVAECVPGCAAAVSGQIKEGDILVSIDHIALRHKKLEVVKQLSAGSIGSTSLVHVTDAHGAKERAVLLTRVVPGGPKSKSLPPVQDSTDSTRYASASGVTPVPGAPVWTVTEREYGGRDPLASAMNLDAASRAILEDTEVNFDKVLHRDKPKKAYVEFTSDGAWQSPTLSAATGYMSPPPFPSNGRPAVYSNQTDAFV